MSEGVSQWLITAVCVCDGGTSRALCIKKLSSSLVAMMESTRRNLRIMTIWNSWLIIDIHE